MEETSFHDARFQKLINQLDDAFVFDAPPHQAEKCVVMDAVETFTDISFNDPVEFVARLDSTVADVDTVHRAPPWSKAVGTIQEVTLPDGFHQHPQEFLHYSVFEGGDTQSTLPHHPNLLRDR